MNAYLAQISINLKLTFRDRTALFFNYLFPLAFFFIFGQMFHAEQGGAILQVVTMVLSIGVLGNGFFGAGIRSVQERETNILRRFKVAPISAAPMLVSSLVTGLLVFLPSVILMLLLAHFVYGMPFPRNWLSLLIFISFGILAFRAIGMITAAVVNSMAESQVVIQVLYFPMLFLSGITIPISLMPPWLQTVAQFLPATHLLTGMQGILMQHENLLQNASSLLALLVTAALATFIGVKLFRWEKEEIIPAAGKLWVLAVLAPFFIIGAWQAYSKGNVEKSKVLAREMRRSRTLLIRGARIFVGDGRVIESGAVLIRNGKIEEVYDGAPPDPKALKAELMEASGKTLLPGFIDVHVHLVASGGLSLTPAAFEPDKTMPRELAAYLYSGVMTVKSVGDPLDQALKTRALVNSGQHLGAELFTCGPMFTAAGGHGTEYFRNLPEAARKSAEQQTVRLPQTPAEARAQVEELKRRGVDGIKAILEAGEAGMLFNRLDPGILAAIAAAARAQNLPLVVHTGDARDVADALSAGADGIEHGSFRDAIPDAAFAEMKSRGIVYDPTLAVIEGFRDVVEGALEPLERPLVLQVGPPALIDSTRKFLGSPKAKEMRERLGRYHMSLERGRENLLRAWKNGVTLVTGTDSGNPLLFHGPALHRELQLWVEAGIPPAVALRAATYNGAKLLRADGRIGAIRKGLDASLILVDGNPMQDIKQTQSIQSVIFKGERVDRPDLFDQE